MWKESGCSYERSWIVPQETTFLMWCLWSSNHLKKSSRRIKAQNSQTEIQEETVNTVKDEERLVQDRVHLRPSFRGLPALKWRSFNLNLTKEEVQSQDDLEESDDLIPDEVDLTPNFSFNNSETSHGFVPGEPEIIDLRSNWATNLKYNSWQNSNIFK